jgi:type IV pilus assembly protein PilC
MPVFNYQAIDQRGRTINGVMPPMTSRILKRSSGRLGLAHRCHDGSAAFRCLEAATSRKEWWAALGKIRRRELIEFCTLMSFQTRVGIPLIQALEMAANDCGDGPLPRVLDGMKQHIESGLLFHEALEKYPQAFSPHFVSVVRRARLSSKLPDAFTDLKKYLRWVEQVVADVRQASLYPAITLAVVSAFGLFLFTLSSPIRDPAESRQRADPNAHANYFRDQRFRQSDVVVCGRSGSSFCWWVFRSGGASPSASPISWITSRSTSRSFGELNLMLAISRFSHNLSILYSSGIPIIQSLNLCQGLIDACRWRRPWSESRRCEVWPHDQRSDAEAQNLPPILIRMVTMGESTGKLDESLQKRVRLLQRSHSRRIKKVFTFLEPAMTLTLIFMVGAIALSIYMPLLTLMSSIGK